MRPGGAIMDAVLFIKLVLGVCAIVGLGIWLEDIDQQRKDKR